MDLVCPIRSLDLCDMFEEHKEDYAESLGKTIDLAVAEPPYSIRQRNKDLQSNHDKLLVDEMMVKKIFCQEVMKPG